MAEARPLVLGDGIAGLCLAWELARAGAPPLVVGGAHPRTSEAAAGMLSPSPEMALAPGLARLAAAALRHYPGFLADLAADTDIEPGFQRSGVLRLAYGDAEAEALREQAGTYEAAGLPSQWLSASRCAAEVPGVGARGLSGGLLSFDEAQVQPQWMLAALEAALRRRGGEVRAGEVVSVSAGAGAVSVGLASGEQLLAPLVAVALGSWTARLPGLAHLLQPVRGQLLVFPEGPGPARILYWGHNYVLTKADGSVVVGGTVEPDAGFEEAPSPAVEGLRELLPLMWPGLAGLPATARTGLRPRAPDGLPLVGALPGWPGVYVFSGHYRNGFLLAPLTARLAAGEMLGGPKAPLLERARPGRVQPPTA